MDETEIDLRAIVGVVQRRWRMIALCLAICIGGAGMVLFSLTPRYTAAALILVDPSNKNLLSTDASNGLDLRDNGRLDSEAEILKADATMLRVVNDEDLISDPEFGVSLGLRDKLLTLLRMSDGELPSGPDALQVVMAKFKSAVSVRRKGLTYLISVEVDSADPEKAARLANALSKSYIDNQLQGKVGELLSARDILKARMSEALSLVSESEASVDNYVFENLDRISNETGANDLLAMRTQLLDVDAERERQEQLAEIIQQGIARQSFESLAASLSSDAVNELEQQREAVLAKIATNETDADTVVDLRAELAAVEEQMLEAARAEQSELSKAISAAQDGSSGLRSQIRAAAFSGLPPAMQTEVFDLQQNATIARTQYQTLLSRLREIETQAALQVADSRIVSPAMEPRKPSFPKPTLILALASMLGIGAGVGIAFLSEFYFGGFSTVGQIETVLRARVLSVVPKLKGKARDAGLTPADALIESPLSSFSESIRRIRAGIDQFILQRTVSASDEKTKTPGIVVMVCSAEPNEGKSTMALALARAYQMAGKKTLLIDTDLRKPSLHKQIGQLPTRGLFTYLSGDNEIALSDVMTADTATGLDVIVGEGRSTMPTDQLVTGRRFRGLIDSATRHFDIVVLDTPPVGPVVDALYLGRYSDVLVMVVKWAAVGQNDVKSSLARLIDAMPEHAQAGLVLNQQEGNQRGNYNKYSGYYDEG